LLADLLRSLGIQSGNAAAAGPAEVPYNRDFAKWFVLSALLLGTAARVYFVLFTPGTYDVGIWKSHAEAVNRLGLMDYYRANPLMNHPPLISLGIAQLLTLSTSLGIPFSVLLRSPFALLDLGTATILFLTLKNYRPWGVFVAPCYYLYPLSVINSAYHGNTDSAVAFFLVVSAVLVSRKRYAGAAVACGLCLNVKLPILLGIPALTCAIPGLFPRLRFVGALAAAGLAGYLPALLTDPAIIVRNVVGYRGLSILTTAGVPIWGMASIVSEYRTVFLPLQTPVIARLLSLWLDANTPLVLLLITVLSVLRIGKHELLQLFATLNAVYTVFYGFNNYWSFQYFAWSLPFWFTATRWFSIPAALLAGGYVYGLYWLVCGGPGLTGSWDFNGHPYWPPWLTVLRNLTVLFFFVTGCLYLAAAYPSRQGSVSKTLLP
jgi:hypothetical protein